MNRNEFLRIIGLGSLIPFVPVDADHRQPRTVTLKEFYIAGFVYYDGVDVVDAISHGEILDLRPEPDNEHDAAAIEIFTRQGMKLGYVPRVDNTVMSELLKQHVPLHAKITDVNPDNETWEMVKVAVTMTDGKYFL